MTRYVGSRASGYPPDLVSFRRCAGAPADCVRLRWCSGVLALQARWGELFGKPPRSGGGAQGDRPVLAGVNDSRRTAAPTRATRPAWAQSSNCSRKFGARSRSSERNELSVLTFPPIQQMEKTEFVITIATTNGAGNGSTEPRQSNPTTAQQSQKKKMALFQGSIEPLLIRRAISDLRRIRAPWSPERAVI
jgi:hypothetical protein